MRTAFSNLLDAFSAVAGRGENRREIRRAGVGVREEVCDRDDGEMSSLEQLRLVSDELERELRLASPASQQSDIDGGDLVCATRSEVVTSSVSSCAFLLGGLVRSSFAAELLLAEALEEPDKTEPGEII